jgi:hypothetical protein
VTLSDEEARRRGTQKTVLERKAPPTFDVVVEIHNWNRVAVHADVAETVDSLLRGFPRPATIRYRDEQGGVRTEEQSRSHFSVMRDGGFGGLPVRGAIPDEARRPGDGGRRSGSTTRAPREVPRRAEAEQPTIA